MKRITSIFSYIKRNWAGAIFIGSLATIFGGLILQEISEPFHTFVKVCYLGTAPIAARLYTWHISATLVPNGVLEICGLIIFASSFILCKAIWDSVSKVTVRNYVSDTFDDINWRWAFDRNRQIVDLRAYCPRCDFQIYAQDCYRQGSLFSCESCSKFNKNIPKRPHLITDYIIRKAEQNLRATSTSSKTLKSSNV